MDGTASEGETMNKNMHLYYIVLEGDPLWRHSTLCWCNAHRGSFMLGLSKYEFKEDFP